MVARGEAIGPGIEDLAGDLSGELRGGKIVDLTRFDNDPDLAAGLDRVRLLDSRERVAHILQLLEALDVGLEHLAAGAGPRTGDHVGDLHERRLDGGELL